MSVPAATWLSTTSATAARIRAASAAESTGTPSSLANIVRTRSAGRGRLPAWVVKKRPVLRCTTAARSVQSRHDFLAQELQRPGHLLGRDQGAEIQFGEDV